MNTQTTISEIQASRGYLVLLAIGGALGGLLFGYDTAVISGAIGYMKTYFNLTAEMTGWAASSLLIGAMFGSLMGGPLSDRFGRKPMMMACAVLFALSGLGSALAQDMTVYSWSRLIGGLGIGAISVVSPLYIAEVAPERVRGAMISGYQFALVIGILLSFLVNLLIQRYGATLPDVAGVAWNVVYGWRWMLGMLVLPSVIFGILILFLPESPRWLMKRGRRAEAERVLAGVGGSAAASREIEQIEESLQEEEGKFSELFQSGFGRATLIGIGLAIFSQFGGVNAIMYYGPMLFTSAGSGESQAFTATVVLGLTNVIAVFPAIALMDRLGRRTLLITGVSIQIVALLSVGLLYHLQAGTLALLAFFILFLLGFGISSGTVTWVVIAEIFPTKLRGAAMGVSVLFLWGADYIVSQTFPMLKASIGPSKTFLIYACCCILYLVFSIIMVPETKGKSLEEIEQSWMKSRKHPQRGS